MTARYMASAIIFLLSPIPLGQAVFSDSAASIVPGERIGSVHLGMTRAAVHRALLQPQRIHRLTREVIQEIWLRPLTAPELAQERKSARYLRWNYLMIYFRRGRVEQVEASSAAFQLAGGLSVLDPPLYFRRHFGEFIHSDHEFWNHSPGLKPAGKHWVWYDDAVGAGLAWKYSAWGNLAHDADPAVRPQDAIIVHEKGQRLLVDPDGGVSLVQH